MNAERTLQRRSSMLTLHREGMDPAAIAQTLHGARSSVSRPLGDEQQGVAGEDGRARTPGRPRRSREVVRDGVPAARGATMPVGSFPMPTRRRRER